MLNLLASRLTNRLVKEGIVSSDSIDIYIYGFEVFFSSFFSTLLLLVIGTMIGYLIETVVFFIVFITLRSFTGGFHANTYFLCMSFTALVYTLVMIAAAYLSTDTYSLFILLSLGMVSIIIKAPIRNLYKPLTQIEYKRHKVTSVIIYVLFAVFGLIIKRNYQVLSRIVFFTLLADVVLMFIKTKYKAEK